MKPTFCELYFKLTAQSDPSNRGITAYDCQEIDTVALVLTLHLMLICALVLGKELL